MPALIIIGFFLGMTLLALVVVVVETPWVVALVGITHMAASAVLAVLLIRQLSREEREDEEADAHGRER